MKDFMHGRYGFDDLSYFLLKIYLILIIVDFFIHSIILFALGITLISVIVFRTLSKNTYARLNENRKFLDLKKSLLFKDNDYIYRKCHFCKTKLRLPIPSKKGIKHVKCPDCKKRNTFLILRSQKIEVIKNKRTK